MAFAEAPVTSALPPQGTLDVQIPSEPIERIAIEDEASITTSSPGTSSEAKSRLCAKPPTRITIEGLPNELLSNIFGHLDSPQPSATALHDEPTFDLTRSEVTDLKSISYVSKRWRRATLPVLFRHAKFVIQDPKTQRSILDKQMQPFFYFVAQNQLRRVITSFALLVHDKKVASSSTRDRHLNDLSAFWKVLFDVIDPIELIVVAPAEALSALTSCHVYLEDVWCFDCPCQYLRLQRAPPPAFETSPTEDAMLANEYPLDDTTYQVFEPVTTTFSTRNIPEDLLSHSTAAPNPSNIASDMVKVFQANASSSAQADASSSAATKQPWEITHADFSPLFEARPWSKLLLNEGSFIRAYATYEFWLRQPPSILYDLLGDDTPPRPAFISPTIRDMEYIGVFPMASHFSSLTKHCPRLDRLYVQLVPRNEIMQDPKKMSQVESEDLWMERNSCYALLMRELFNSPPIGNYKYLQVFESGDAADKDAWNMAVEYVKRANNGWKVAEDGVFVRDIEDLPPAPEVGIDGGEATSFEGSLIRWAWKGTTKLPVSAYPLYDRPLGPLN